MQEEEQVAALTKGGGRSFTNDQGGCLAAAGPVEL